jgi:hypothetical protein
LELTCLPVHLKQPLPEPGKFRWLIGKHHTGIKHLLLAQSNSNTSYFISVKRLIDWLIDWLINIKQAAFQLYSWREQDYKQWLILLTGEAGIDVSIPTINILRFHHRQLKTNWVFYLDVFNWILESFRQHKPYPKPGVNPGTLVWSICAGHHYA